MEVTLNASTDDHARTALFIYARLTENAEMYKDLLEVSTGRNMSDSIPCARMDGIDDPERSEDEMQIFHILSGPDGTIECMRRTFDQLKVTPVAIVVHMNADYDAKQDAERKLEQEREHSWAGQRP